MTIADELTRLGRRHQQLRASLADLAPHLDEAIRAAAAAGMPQKAIIAATGYSREAVRQIVKPHAREAANAARRKPQEEG